MSLTTTATAERPTAIRVHRMRVARGACWVISSTALTGLSLVLLDAAIRLPDWMRGLALAAWLTGSGVMAWYLVLRRWQTRGPGNPARSAARELSINLQAAACASAALLGCLLTALLTPNAAIHVQRVVFPWYRPAASQYRVVVTSSDPIVPVGGSVTLSAYVERLDPTASPPENAVLVCRELDGTETRLEMVEEQPAVYHATRSTVRADFHYRVEAGGIASDWFTVWAIPPVEPTGDSSLEVLPPAYAADAIPQQKLHGFVSFGGIQYGKVELALHFNRPALNAYLRIEPVESAEVQTIPVALAGDGLSGAATMTLKHDGVLRLVTVSEQNGKTLTTGTYAVVVKIAPDGPPRLDRVEGVSLLPLQLKPGQILHVEVDATDDIAVGKATVEYAIGSGETSVASMPLTRPGPRRAEGRIDLDLRGIVREGDTVRYRVRVADTRRLQEPELKPQEVLFPESGWATLTIASTAPPIEEQEIVNQREVIRGGLENAVAEIRELSATIQSLRAEPRLELHHEVLLRKLPEQCGNIGRALDKLAGIASLTPDLQPLAEAYRGVVERPLRNTAEILRHTLSDAASVKVSLANAGAGLTNARERLEVLQEVNRDVAAARIDARRLAAILSEERALADRVRAGDGSAAEEMSRLQKELRDRLIQVVARSETLRPALAESNQRSILAYSAKLSDLAAAVANLDEAMRTLEAEVRKGVLDDVAGGVAAAAKRVVKLLAKIELAARIAIIPLPKPEEFARVTESIVAGKTFESLTELQRLAESLVDVAIPLEKAVAERGDAKLACRQFAAWLDDFRARFRTANFNALPPAAQMALRDELSTLRASVSTLSLPPSRELASARDEAVEHLGTAVERLKGTGANAETALKSAQDVLTRLAENVPSLSDRFSIMRSLLDDIRQKQENIWEGIRPALALAKPDLANPEVLAKKLNPFFLRQQKQLAAFKALDLPGLERLRTRVACVLAAAAADLESGLPYDIHASQECLKRELELLKFTLTERNPVDDRAGAIETDLQKIQHLSWNRNLAVESALEKKRINAKQEPAASKEERDALKNDAKELMLVRVGPAGQGLKKRALDLYQSLGEKTVPDRWPDDQKAIATLLDEIAARMADVPDLAQTVERIVPVPVSVADAYLPSKAFADALRDRAADYRRARERLNHLADAIHQQTHASANSPLTATQKRQRELEARCDELAARAGDLAAALRRAAAERHPDDGVAPVIAEAAQSAAGVAKTLGDASRRSASGEPAVAENLRKEARATLLDRAGRIAKVAPVVPASSNPDLAAAADSLLRALSDMRLGEELLAAKSDPRTAETALRKAVESLAAAIASRLRAATANL